MVKTEYITVSTKGNADVVDITKEIQQKVKNSPCTNGIVTVFVSGSTASVTTIEYEPGLVKDIGAALDKIAPPDKYYHHHERWGDDNGHAHVRASLMGPSIAIPFSNKKLLLGQWQQVILIDFDTSSRQREIVVQIMGE